MIVVHTRTSASPSANVSITFSSAPSPICPWPTTIRAVGQQPSQLLGLRLDRLDAVVDVEDLAAAVELAHDRVPHEPGGSPPRHRVWIGSRSSRRRLDDAHVADARRAPC